MRLSTAGFDASVSLQRDGVFENLGFVAQSFSHCLVFLESERFIRALQRNPEIAGVITSPELAKSIPQDLALAVSDQPRIAFAKLHNHLARTGFYWEDFATQIHPDARIHPTAFIAVNNVQIGPQTHVGPHATILERCRIGANVQVGANCVLGGVGFQTVRAGGEMLELEHAGGLMVEDDARVLPGAVIATGLFRHDTIISHHARVGSQAFVSHAVTVGERAFIGHGSVVNGNVSIGREAWIGPGAVIAQELKIGDNAIVSLGAVVIGNVESGERVSGNFAIPHRRLLRILAQSESGQ